MAAEVMGIIQGSYGGSSRDLRAGGLSFQSSYTPHGGKIMLSADLDFLNACLIVPETYETYELATTSELKPERVGEGFLGTLPRALWA